MIECCACKLVYEAVWKIICSGIVQSVNMETKQDFTALIRINGKKWARKRVELYPEPHFDILNADTFCFEWRIGRGSFLSVKNVPSTKVMFLRACPKNSKGERVFNCYEVEFENGKDQELFHEYLRQDIKEREKHTMTKPNCKLFDILEHSKSEQRPADKLIRK